MPDVITYPTLDAFYDALPWEVRRFSREVDFGVHWTDEPQEGQILAALPRWRVSWIENTGELYAALNSSPLNLQRIRVYGSVKDEAAAEGLMAGLAGALQDRRPQLGRGTNGDPAMITALKIQPVTENLAFAAGAAFLLGVVLLYATGRWLELGALVPLVMCWAAALILIVLAAGSML